MDNILDFFKKNKYYLYKNVLSTEQIESILSMISKIEKGDFEPITQDYQRRKKNDNNRVQCVFEPDQLPEFLQEATEKINAIVQNFVNKLNLNHVDPSQPLQNPKDIKMGVISVIKSLLNCMRQGLHFDFKPGINSHHCYGIILFLQDKSRLVKGENQSIIKANAGDMIIFRGDFIHAGSEYTSLNARIHYYFHPKEMQLVPNTSYPLEQNLDFFKNNSEKFVKESAKKALDGFRKRRATEEKSTRFSKRSRNS